MCWLLLAAEQLEYSGRLNRQPAILAARIRARVHRHHGTCESAPGARAGIDVEAHRSAPAPRIAPLRVFKAQGQRARAGLRLVRRSAAPGTDLVAPEDV